MTRFFLTLSLCALITGPALAQVADDPAGLAMMARVADAREMFLSGDHEAALAVLRPAADAGNLRAQNIVGAAHQYGQGVPVSATEAIRYFEMAAARNFAPAIHNLGVLHEVGMDGVAPDPVLAREFYRRASDLDYPPSHAAYAYMLYGGVGGPVDLVNAVRIFERGAQMGDPYALGWMAYFLATGEAGVAQDFDRAFSYYAAAAHQGVPEAMDGLGQMFERGEGTEQDLRIAMDWYTRAVAADYAPAGINAAWTIWENPDDFPDQVEGLAYCFWAAAQPVDSSGYSYVEDCDGAAADFTGDEVQMARKLAASL